MQLPLPWYERCKMILLCFLEIHFVGATLAMSGFLSLSQFSSPPIPQTGNRAAVDRPM